MSGEPEAFEVTGQPPPAALAEARVALHWAAQLPAAAGRALIPAVPDDSHTGLAWLPGPRLLAGGRTPAGQRAALRAADSSLVILGPGDVPGAELALTGRTFADALAWLAAALRVPPGVSLSRADYDMPPHAVADGGRFGDSDAVGRAELARWYATADAILHRVARAHAGASPVRCWPHHFDIATLLPGPAEGRSVGVGLSPGDGSYAQPYWYVTPWPYPEARAFADLPAGGHWHTAGWVGAVLTGEILLTSAQPAARARAVVDFLEGAVSVCQTLLGAA
jgi:hypothetical protein